MIRFVSRRLHHFLQTRRVGNRMLPRWLGIRRMPRLVPANLLGFGAARVPASCSSRRERGAAGSKRRTAESNKSRWLPPVAELQEAIAVVEDVHVHVLVAHVLGEVKHFVTRPPHVAAPATSSPRRRRQASMI